MDAPTSLPIDGTTLGQLDPLYEHRLRLAVGALLMETDSITFSRFKDLLKATNGNLGAQLRKLEDAGYVSVRKDFVGRQPTTWYSLTKQGRQALENHMAGLKRLIQAAD